MKATNKQLRRALREHLGAHDIFHDARDRGSLLLSANGFALMRERFPYWSEPITETMSVANHTYLVSVSIFPYIVVDKVLTTFDSNLGVLMKMVNGDFAKLEALLPRE